MTEKQREAIYLTETCGLSIRDAARSAGCGESAIKRRRLHARKKLGGLLPDRRCGKRSAARGLMPSVLRYVA